jgi:hypothetical protein
MKPTLNYAGVCTAGSVAIKILGDRVFVICFITGPGETGTVTTKK